MKILDYIKGSRKGIDAHLIERQAMDDPFLADALDGYNSVNTDHTLAISNMQAYVSAQTLSQKKDSGAWKIAVAAVVFIAVLGGYFTLMNHQSNMLVAHEQESSYINLYIPASYVEQKGLELAEMEGNGTDLETKAVANISNFDEVIKPIERIEIYVPSSYYAQLSKEEEKELAVLTSNRTQESNSIGNTRDFYAEAISPTNNGDMVKESILPSASSLPKQPTPAPMAKMVAESSVPASSSYLSGKVVDESNEPIIGATVVLKGTDKGAVTDIDGNYELPANPSGNNDLVASYLGFETIEIPDAKNDQRIAMKESNETLSEITVTGYGAVKNRELASSSSHMSNSEMVSKKKVVKPKPVGGERNYKTYIKENMVTIFDPSCQEAQTYGTVILTFDVTPEGKPTNIKVDQGLCEPYNNEAIRLLKEGPNWTYTSSRGELKVYFKQE